MKRIRTDLALEASNLNKENPNTDDVSYQEKVDKHLGVKISELNIKSESIARRIGKDVGKYYTFEVNRLSENDGEYHRDVAVLLSEYLRKMIKNVVGKKTGAYKVLVAGLGNRESTPDALGPMVVSNLCVTRNVEEYKKGRFAITSAIIPGVMAQTGMESAEILRGVVMTTKPEVMIVVDALAARNAKRLANTIQLADTGIMPGSGVGNHRNAINFESMKVPVIALGVPMVVDAAAIVEDTLKKMAFAERSTRYTRKYIRSHMPANMAQMYVTPKDVDSAISRISFTISEALNIALY